MTDPVRLQLSRKAGFRLQDHSLATNGLPAVNVSRPTKWGNPYDWRDWREVWPFEPNPWGTEINRDDWCRDRATQSFEEALSDGEVVLPVEKLRGKNLACWCKRGAPCHADVLLDLANRPRCEEASP